MATAAKAETNGNKYPAEKLSAGINWYLLNMSNNGRHIHDVLQKDEIPANLSNGWVIRSDIKVLKHMETVGFIMQPDEVIWPWGDNARAQKQMKAWEKELGGPIVHLLVPDPEQKDAPWLAQPVLRSWLLEGNIGGLVALYNKTESKNPDKLRYRAAVIALTGKPPEKFRPKEKNWEL